MFLCRCELPYFSEYIPQLKIPPALQVPPSYMAEQQWVIMCLLKLLQMFISKFSSSIVSITSSLLDHMFKEQYFIKGCKLSENMVICVKM